MFAEDLSAFFSPADFAQRITLAGVEVDAIFDNAYALGGVGGLGMGTTAPAITLPTAQVPANPVGAAVQVGAAAYVVATHEPNGTGVSVLLLESTP